MTSKKPHETAAKLPVQKRPYVAPTLRRLSADEVIRKLLAQLPEPSPGRHEPKKR